MAIAAFKDDVNKHIIIDVDLLFKYESISTSLDLYDLFAVMGEDITLTGSLSKRDYNQDYSMYRKEYVEIENGDSGIVFKITDTILDKIKSTYDYLKVTKAIKVCDYNNSLPRYIGNDEKRVEVPFYYFFDYFYVAFYYGERKAKIFSYSGGINDDVNTRIIPFISGMTKDFNFCLDGYQFDFIKNTAWAKKLNPDVFICPSQYDDPILYWDEELFDNGCDCLRSNARDYMFIVIKKPKDKVYLSKLMLIYKTLENYGLDVYKKWCKTKEADDYFYDLKEGWDVGLNDIRQVICKVVEEF